MRGSEFAELSAFAAIVEHGSFVRAAAQLGVSPSALSQTIRVLEERLGVRLLHRTTRSVAPSAAGERLIARLGPALIELRAAVADVHEARDQAVGPLRINTLRLGARRVLAPLLARFHDAHPDVVLDVVVDDAIVDIVAGRFDAGIRLGERLDQDMIAMKISTDLRLVVVAAPSYLATHGTPQHPRDLQQHSCLNGRMPTDGRIYRWELERDGEQIDVAVNGPLICNEPDIILRACLDGMGIACAFDTEVVDELADGRLVEVLPAWSPTFPGFHLYWPGRKHPSAPLRALIDFLKRGAPPISSSPSRP